MSSAVDITKMTPAERLDLMGRLWDSLDPTDLGLAERDRRELVERSADLDADLAAGRAVGTAWSDVRSRLLAKTGRR